MKGNAGFRSASGGEGREDHMARGGVGDAINGATVVLDKGGLCALKTYTPMRQCLGLVGVNWVPESSICFCRTSKLLLLLASSSTFSGSLLCVGNQPHAFKINSTFYT